MVEPPQDPREAYLASVDWNAVRASARRGLAPRMKGFTAEDLEDAIQDVSEGYLEFIRRSGAPRTPEGLLLTIVRAVAAGSVNRKKTERRAHENPELRARLYTDDDSERAALEAYVTTCFLMREYLRLKRAPCVVLADLKARNGSLKEHARTSGLSYDKVRQDWSRCAKVVRDAVRSGRLRIPWMPPPRGPSRGA